MPNGACARYPDSLQDRGGSGTYGIRTLRHCPFRNDCNAKEQKRAGNYVVFVSPNAKERIITKALVRSEDYKDICRFRNGVETIPNIVRNHMGIDKLPIGMKIKQAYVAVDMAAVNSGKFSMGRAHIRDNPILRSFG